MWKPVELHNHSTESDGRLPVEELAAYFHQNHISAFSLTDHNTISGFPGLRSFSERADFPFEYIQGYELTSYYGHLLCQNVPEYIPWDDISPFDADFLFERVHKAGGLAGPAHPFSIPSPFSNGMRWDMRIHDPALMDFIEVINNAHPMFPDNTRAIEWWESLLFRGFHIAAASGMDFHSQLPAGRFTTYIEVPDRLLKAPLSLQLEHAVKGCRTCVSRGPIADWEVQGNRLIVSASSGGKYLCQLRSREGSVTKKMENASAAFDLSALSSAGKAAVIMLYPAQERILGFHTLAAIAPPLFQTEGGWGRMER